VVFNQNESYRLHANVALRPEPFGALAYHYGNRKLVFLKSPRLVNLVKTIGDHSSVNAALDQLQLSPRARENYLGALTSLAQSDMIVQQNATAASASEIPATQPALQETINATVS
jgi:putative mycofactocin binding protein MftB